MYDPQGIGEILPKYSRNLMPISGLDDRNLLPSLDPPCKTLPLLSTTKVETSQPRSANIFIYLKMYTNVSALGIDVV